MVTALTKKIKINTPTGEKEVTLYSDCTAFDDYESNKNYIAVNTDEGIGYIYCNSSSVAAYPEDHFLDFYDKDGNIRHAYTKIQYTTFVYTFETGYAINPIISEQRNYDCVAKDKDNGDGTTTRTLAVQCFVDNFTWYGAGENTLFLSGETSHVLSFDDCSPIKVKTCRNMFRKLDAATYINLKNIDTSEVEDMTAMFFDCGGLTTLDVSTLDTRNATSMEAMYCGCQGLTSLDLSTFNTSKLKNMATMFYLCHKIETIDFTGWDTRNNESLYATFMECNKLHDLDITMFNTSKVTNMQHTFDKCSSLVTLDLSNFDIGNCTDMGLMFNECSALKSANYPNFGANRVADTYCMFYLCNNLETINLCNFETINCNRLSWTFGKCTKLSSLDIRSMDTTNVKDIAKMFYHIPSTCNVYVGENFKHTESAGEFSGKFQKVSS